MFPTEVEKLEFSVHPIHMTTYRCSHCGAPIPITNVFVHRQTLLQRLLGLYDIEGFWCPVCGDAWTRCERIP